MNRNEKIKAIQAIQSGKLSPVDIRERRIYLFKQRLDKPGYYEKEGELFSEEQVKEFSMQADAVNIGREAAGMEPDIIIYIDYEKSNLNLGREITLNIE